MKKLPQLIALVSLSILALLAGGCASIVKGTTQAIPVSSSPSGATVRLDGNHVGQTPTSVEVKRKSDHLLTIEKKGYQPESVAITRNIGGAVFGNILAGGLIGWGVDAISGAQYNLTPATVSVTLQPIGKEGVVRKENDAAIFIEELKKLDTLHEGGKVTDEEYAKRRIALMEKYSPTAQGGSEASSSAEDDQEKEPYRNLTPGLAPAKEPTPTETPAPKKSVEDKLRDLQKLRDSGLISEDEFQAKRKAIIDQL